MPPLERLFRLEVEFHRRLRSEANEPPDAGGVHTSYALQAGYEPLLRSIGAWPRPTSRPSSGCST